MLKFAKNYPAVADYLPVENEIKKLSRNYIGCIIYTIVGTPFEEFINGKVEERNKKIKDEKNLLIEMHPTIH